jgi:fructose-specific PTS system IIA-like component
LAVEYSFAFPLPQGLHARPASLIQETAARFPAKVVWDNLGNGNSADAKSVLSLIGTDTQHGDPCRIRAEGADEGDVLRALRHLIEAELPEHEKEADAGLAAMAGKAGIPRILVLEKATFFQGLPAGRGIIRGRVLVHDPALEMSEEETPPGLSSTEEQRAYLAAAASLENEMRRRREETHEKTERAVLDAHLALLRDPAFSAKVTALIAAEGISAAAAVSRTCRIFCDMLQAGRSRYLRERMADIRDVSRRLLVRLSGPSAPETRIRLAAPAILIAEDLSPSQFLALDKSLLLGLGLETAGVTSHALIMSRARGIPAITGCPGLREKLRSGEEVILDGSRGLIIPAPAAAVGRYYEREMEAERKRTAARRKSSLLPGRTADDRAVEIAANIGHPEELQAAWNDGAEGVGLFRTEWLLMDRTSPPGEEEQYALYARLAAEAKGRPIIVRTFDIGGDKPISFLPLPPESNPFLGFRGIRVYERFAGLIRAQLRAILRAAAEGPLKIMFPMVSMPEEILGMKELLRQVAEELAAAAVPHRPDVPVGMMVEVPSAALQIDRFSEHVDFFSVGSNDLLQYLFAADRGHPSLPGFGRPHHPAFLRLLKTIVEAAHGQGKWIGLCGEAAASPRMLPLLVGLGFDELSMTSSAIPEIKSRLRGLESAACRELVEAAVGLPVGRDVDALLDSFERRGEREALITPELVRIGSDSRSKAEVLQELAVMMEAAGRVGSRDEIEAALWQREDTFSTGIGFGMAIPHGQTAAVRSASVGFLRFAVPFAWDAADSEAVEMAVMLVLPAADSNRDHLKILARLSRRLADEEFRAELRAAADETAAAEIISGALAGAP